MAKGLTAPDKTIAGLAKAKWRASGLSDDHARTLGLRPLTGEEVAGLADNFHGVGALLIPYFDLKGKQTKFYRLRYLERLPGFAGIVEKPQRYAQPTGTLNEIYLPPLLPVKWEDVAADPNVPIYITEGELKAASGCSCGLATIGLGGVDVWRSTKRGLELLPALQEIIWKGRQVVIVYDSDAATNPNVVRAQRKLAKELIVLGAMPAIASLPAGKDGAKQGLDDFLVAHGEKALLKIVQDAPFFPEAEALWAMNEEVLYVRESGVVVVRDTGQRIDPGRFVRDAYSNRHYVETTVTTQGLKTKKCPTAKRWLEWEARFEVQRMTFAPGQPKIYDGQWNSWGGWAVQPVKGDVGPWRWLLEFLFKSDPIQAEWFEKWCAYPIQHPGAKLYTSVLIWGRDKGTGKSFVPYMLMGIYGKYAVEIKNKDLRGGFNGWAKDRQLIYGDEISGDDARVDREWLKGLITQPYVRINEKYLPEYVTHDHMNYLFTSNHPDALFVEDNDRRYFVHEVIGPPADRALYEMCHKWLHGDGPPGSYKGPGASHLFHHLLSLDLGNFNPREHAPLTAAKKNMIMAGKSDLGMWCVQLKEDPSTMLRPVGEKAAAECDLFTPDLLRRAYDPEGRTRVTAPGVGRELGRSGFRALNRGEPIWLRKSKRLVRLYAVRNQARWAEAPMATVCDHYEYFFGAEGKKF